MHNLQQHVCIHVQFEEESPGLHYAAVNWALPDVRPISSLLLIDLPFLSKLYMIYTEKRNI